VASTVPGASTEVRPTGPSPSTVSTRTGVVLLLVVMTTFLLVVLPVVLRGAPLRDDFDVCLSPRFTSGPERMVAELWQELGVVRLLGRFTELSIIAGLCHSVPFSIIILIPLLITCLVGLVLRAVLYDVGLRAPWPEIGAALWFLQPLGTEAALWPAALHVPLGLLLGLIALRLYARGHLGRAALFGLAASWSLEQVLFALPAAVWLVTPERHRARAMVTSGLVAIALLAAFISWPGLSTRTAVPLSQRVLAIVTDPIWYVKFPAIGTGMISIPLAVFWSLPWSVLVMMTAALLGFRYAPSLVGALGSPGWRGGERLRLAGALAGLVLLVSLPMMVTLPHEHGPRVFTPVWLSLAAFAAVAGSRMQWRRPRVAGAVGGVIAGGALLSLTFSVWVRIETADFTEATSRWIGAHVPDRGRAVICDVPRTAVNPAPNGPFALHEFHEPWAARAAVQYYTGRRVEIARTGVFWDDKCADLGPADVIVSFETLRRRGFAAY
jgi:hypothetical protein